MRSDSVSDGPVAIGWVPNISRTVTGNRHVSECFEDKCVNGGFRFVLEGRIVTVHSEIDNNIIVAKIKMMDESGLCWIYDERPLGIPLSKCSDDMRVAVRMQEITEMWLAFRGLIDSSTNPDYAPKRNEEYTTEMAECAICTAMNNLVMYADLSEPDRWADAIAERFILHSEALIDNLKSYPRKYKYWSNPKHFWNRHAVIRRSIKTVAMSQTDFTYFRSFVEIYRGELSEMDVTIRKMELRNERTSVVSAYINARMGSVNLNWLIISIIVAIVVGTVSIVSANL